MIAEAIKAIAGLVSSAERMQVMKVEDLPRKVFIRKGGELIERDVPAPERNHTVTGLDDLLRMLDTSGGIATQPEVYVGAGKVEAFLDSSTRVDRVTLPLPRTHRVTALMHLTKEPSLTIPDAIRLLRFELYGEHSAALIGALRKVDFQRKSAGIRSTEHGRESLGRSVEASVQGVEQIPEEFRVRLPVFNVQGLRSIEIDVAVRIHIQPEQERLHFIPLKDELESALGGALDQVRLLIEKDLPDGVVFLGTP